MVFFMTHPFATRTILLRAVNSIDKASKGM
nr:MAG TPA: hypothetical protein [Caudoviricetes sp.]DAP20725.1 MAG TPA: hypothetical protein [Caudoviricetes sp.]